MTSNMISCNLHDYVEIACMYGFEIELGLKSQDKVVGKAKTVQLDSNKQECLIVDDNERVQSIPLENVKTMRAITPNPHFSSVSF